MSSKRHLQIASFVQPTVQNLKTLYSLKESQRKTANLYILEDGTSLTLLLGKINEITYLLLN